MSKQPVKIRKTCKHPGRIWNRCRSCPLNRKNRRTAKAGPTVYQLG